MTAAPASTASGLLGLLIGAPGSGKSTWACRHVPREQLFSSDELRAAVCGDPNDQAATPYAIRLLHTFVEARLHFRRPTVVDATNAEQAHRETMLDLARACGVPAVAVVFDIPLDVCRQRNARRHGARRVPDDFVRATHERIRGSLPVTGPQPPAGFVAAIVVGVDQTRTLGQLPGGCRDAWRLSRAAVGGV